MRTVIPFVVHELALNPEMQLALYRELSAMNGLDRNSLSKLKYMDMVIKETLRRWNPIQCSRRFIKPANANGNIVDVKVDPNFMELTVGDSIWIPTQAIHMDEQYFANPEIFDPERFDEKNRQKLKDDAFFPFGVDRGRRNCH